jgi:hypothetical protein
MIIIVRIFTGRTFCVSADSVCIKYGRQNLRNFKGRKYYVKLNVQIKQRKVLHIQTYTIKKGVGLDEVC